jgi:hypothetical protein
VTRLLSAASRVGLAAVLFLIVLAVLRWAPFHAEPPVDARALPLAAPGVVLAIVAALTGRQRRLLPIVPFAVALIAAILALSAVVALRGSGGLAATVVDARGASWPLRRGAVDVIADDLRGVPRTHKWTLTWEGTLRVPRSGVYRLWVDAVGRASVVLDGHEVFAAEGDPARHGHDWTIGRGEHDLRVRLERVGPGPRLRLGWTRPGLGGRPGTWSETVPPRYLGNAGSPFLWRLTDALAVLVAGLVALLVFVVPWDAPTRPPAPAPVTRAEIGRSLLGHAALAALMSWPLVAHIASAGPLDRPDGRLNTWILAWDVHALTHAPGRLFDAPIFHPLPDALTFTENLLVPAILAAPAILLGTPILGYNLVLLASCVVSGLGAQLLARRVSGDRFAAFAGGAAFAVGAHRWFRLSHLHAEVTLFLPFALLAFDLFWERPTLRRGLLVGLLLALQGLSSVYLGAITATALAVAVGLAVVGGLRPRALLALGAGALLAAALMAPVVAPYLRMRAFQGREFTLDEQANYATNVVSYAASTTRLHGPITARHLDHAAPRDALFPGLALLVLGLAGVARAPRRYQAVAITASLVAIALSLGPETAFYRFLHEHVVFFRGIRALSRFSLIPVLALSVLAAFALAGLRWARPAALALLLVESANIPLRYAPYRPPPAAARWLAGKEGAVAYLPPGPEVDTAAMLDGLAHFRPLLNGDSGFIPRPYDRTMELLEGPVGEDALRFLRSVDVRHVVSRDEREWPLLARFGEERIYAVPEGERAQLVTQGAAVPALWDARGALIDLGEPRLVGRIACELGDAPWIARPRLALSQDGVRWDEVEARASLADATLSLYRDPIHGRGVLRLAPREARFLRLDPRLPCRAGLLWVSP